VRANFYLFRTGQANMNDLNQIPNMRMRTSTRFAVNSMLEVFNHLGGDPNGTAFGQELRPSSSPANPSLYRVDFDPVDVPALSVAGEGISRGFEAYSLENQENGAVELAESSIAIYPAAGTPDSVTPVKVYQVTASDAGDLKVVNSVTDLTIQKLIPGTWADDPTPAGMPVYSEGPGGVTCDSTPVPTDRVGLVIREFDPGTDQAARVRVEEGKQYKIRWHVTSTRAANVQSQIRLRGRALKFMWSQKYEIGGAFGAGSNNNVIAQQALPGVGTQNPDQQTPGENGGWYTMIMHTPMSLDIRPDVAGPLTSRMPAITAEPGPGSSSTSARDLRLGFDLLDTLSGGADAYLEAGVFTIDRIEVRAYEVVDEF
jgi:hypothetical protein